MAHNPMKRYPKMRFALITEDALEMLRPQNKEFRMQDPNILGVKDIYDTIDAIVERKLRNFNLHKLDEIIEDKVCEMHERHREIKKNLRGFKTPKSSDSEISMKTVSNCRNSEIKFDSPYFNSGTAQMVRVKKSSRMNPSRTNCQKKKINVCDYKAKHGNSQITEAEEKTALAIATKYVKELSDLNKQKN